MKTPLRYLAVLALVSLVTFALSGCGGSSKPASQTISFANPGAQTYGSQLTLSATASSGLPVSFSVTSGPANLSGNVVSFTGTGSVTIQATQAGDSRFTAAAPVSQTFTVNPASQTITFADPGAQTFGTPLTLSATASSGLAVSLAVTAGPATLSGNTVTFTGAGSVTVQATQAGNANYAAATPVSRTFAVNPASQTITFANPGAQLYGTPLTLSATATSGLAVSFAVTAGPATISGNSVVFTGAGSVTVQATQAGNANYAVATPVSQTFAVTVNMATTFAFLRDSVVPVGAVRTPLQRAQLHRSIQQRPARQHLACLANASVDMAAGTVDVYLVDTSTGNAARLSTQAAHYNGIHLSADGASVVFTAADTAGYSQIFVASVASFNNPTQLTSSQTMGHFEAAFSPDGKTIISSVVNYTDHTSHLATIPVAGGAETVINLPAGLNAFDPTFTPDATKIVFEGGGVNNGIYLVNLDGSGITQLSNQSEAYWDEFPSISPDGSSVIFARSAPTTGTTPTSDIYQVGIGGESAANPATQLTTDGYSWDSLYVGSNVAFVSWKDNLIAENDSIYLLNTADANSVTRLTYTNTEDSFHSYDLSNGR